MDGEAEKRFGVCLLMRFGRRGSGWVDAARERSATFAEHKAQKGRSHER